MHQIYGEIINGEIGALNVRRGGIFDSRQLGLLSSDETYRKLGLVRIVGEAPVYDRAIETCAGPTYEYDAELDIINKIYCVSLIPEETLIEMKKKALAGIRYEHEIAGIIIDGNLVSTSKESQASMTMVHSNLANGLNGPTISWNESGVFTELDVLQVRGILNEIFKYVQECRTNESVLSTALDLNIDTDLTVGWPVREILI